MKIVYFTQQAFFDEQLCFIRTMSKVVAMYVIMQIAPESRRGPIFDLTNLPLEAGITDARSVLRGMLPIEAEKYWSKVEGFYLSVYDNPKSIHLDTINQGRKIGRLIREIQPDLIFFDNIDMRIALGSPFFWNTPWVIGVHDPEPHSGESNWRFNIAKKLMFGRARQIILHNKSQEKRFSAVNHIHQNRISVIPLGITDIYTHWKHAETSDPRNILFFGRISPYKGLGILFDATTQVCQQVNNVTFTITGSPIKGYQIPPIPSLPNGGSIKLIQKYIPAEELVQVISNSTCVVCPYLDATQSAVVITAYAFHKPVIATRVGGLPEYVKDNETGILVPPNDSNMLAEAIIRFLQDEELQKRLSQGVSNVQLQSLNWDEISNQYLKIFDRVRGKG